MSGFRKHTPQPVARLGADVGRDDQDRHLRHPAHDGRRGRNDLAAHRRIDSPRGGHRYGSLGHHPRGHAERRQAAAGLLLDREHRGHPHRHRRGGPRQGLGKSGRGDGRHRRSPAPHREPLVLQVAALLRRRQSPHGPADHLARRPGRRGPAHADDRPALPDGYGGHLRPAAPERISSRSCSSTSDCSTASPRDATRWPQPPGSRRWR